MSESLLLIPLDDRPVTSRIPVQIGAIGGVRVEVPPAEWLGNLERPAEPEALLGWLVEKAPTAQAVILALDTVAYGGLIPSRQSSDSLETLQRRLAGLIKIKEQNPSLPFYGFSVLMRLSAEAAVEEEKPYWAEHGGALYRYSFHQDKYEQQGDARDLQAAMEARDQVPFEIVQDYLETRGRNAALQRMLVDWTRRNLFDLLVIPQDDTGRFGLNVKEQRQLSEQVKEAKLENRVLLYPGADEVASVLVARHLNRVRRASPAFHVRYSTPYGGTIVPMYEDRPLERTIASQIQAAGGRMTNLLQDADVLLLVNTPSSGQGDLALRTHFDRVDKPERDLTPFVRQLNESLLPTALADVAYANGADPELFRQFRDYMRLAAFAAWNTASNTVGCVVAQACAGLDPAQRDEAAQRSFMLERIADDILYQSQLRPYLQEELTQGTPIDALASAVTPRLNALWQRLVFRLPTASIAASLPWNRLFEIEVKTYEARGSQATDPGDLPEEENESPLADPPEDEPAPRAEASEAPEPMV